MKIIKGCICMYYIELESVFGHHSHFLSPALHSVIIRILPTTTSPYTLWLNFLVILLVPIRIYFLAAQSTSFTTLQLLSTLLPALHLSITLSLVLFLQHTTFPISLTHILTLRFHIHFLTPSILY